MKVGVPTEIKPDEYRVAITPAGVRELTEHGHEVLVQAGAGEGSAIADDDYDAQGARIVADAARRSSREAEMVLKVKEPQPAEVDDAAPGPAPLHLPAPRARPRARPRACCASGATCIAYETVEDARGRLPLLAPMSEVAGKIATQAGAFMLEKPLGGRGILLGGVPGVAAANVMVIGGGVGRHERRVHRDRDGGRRLRLRPLDRPPARARHRLRRSRSTVYSLDAGDRGDAAARRPRDRRGARPRRPRARRRHARAAGADEARARCWSTSRSTRAAASRPRSPTTHHDPTYEVDGITHYCVANMPGAVPITSTYALTNATLPYVLALADHGLADAIETRPGPAAGVNVAARQGHPPRGRRSECGADYAPGWRSAERPRWRARLQEEPE